MKSKIWISLLAVLLFSACSLFGPKVPYDLEMIFVEGGSFTMGDVWGNGDPNEIPTHSVTLNDFYISNVEVTQKNISPF